MNGPKSTSGSIPGTPSQPVTPSNQPSQNQSGVNPLDGQRYTPVSDSMPAGTSIHMRNPRVQEDVLPQVNREKAINQLQSSYKTHYAQAEARRDQLELAHSLKEIRHYLDNPELAKECTSYSIMWIPDDGEPVSVIPPGTELNDRAKATEIRGMLHGQLNKLDQKFTVSKLQQLKEDIGEQEGLMKLAGKRLEEMGEPLPKLPLRERIVLLGGTSAKAPVTGQTPAPKPVPETGQHTPASPAPTPALEPSEDQANTPPPGQFELRLKTPGMSPPRPVNEEFEDEEDKGLSVGSPVQEKESHQLLVQIDDEESFSSPLQPTEQKQPEQNSYTHPASSVRQRPNVRNPVSNQISPLPIPPQARDPERDPENVPPPPPLPVTYSDHYSKDRNIGVPSSHGGAGDTSLQFTRELGKRADSPKYADLHQKMLSKCDLNHTCYASEDDLKESPKLANSFISRLDMGLSGKNTGTVFIDVFKEEFLPNNNPGNRTMIYVMPPDANDYSNPEAFLADCEETARHLTWALQKYNQDVRQLKADGREQELEEIPVFRTGAFSTQQTKFPNISSADIAHRIAAGITKQLDQMYKSDNQPQTIKRIEFADTDNAFSKTPAPKQATPLLQPTMTATPPSMSVSSTPLEPLPSAVASQLMKCPSEVGKALDANMGIYAKEAIGLTHKKSVFESTAANIKPLYMGPLHSARKAMLARAITNFHRKHSQDAATVNRDARYIPDSAIPAIELGVLHTKPAPNAVLKQNSRTGLWLDPLHQLTQKQVPEDTAKAIARATSGYKSDPASNLLDLILQDVELIESRRASAGFDISKLGTYSLYPDKEARKELGELCREYYGMLLKQGDLPPPAAREGAPPTTSAAREGAPPTTFTLSDAKTPLSSLKMSLKPALRQHQEKIDDFYARQIDQLKKAAFISSPPTDLLSSFGQTSDATELKTFGALYTFSKGED